MPSYYEALIAVLNEFKKAPKVALAGAGLERVSLYLAGLLCYVLAKLMKGR